VFVRDFADFANVGTAYKACTTDPDRINFIAGLGNMNQNAGFQNFMIQPFTLVGLDNRRVELIKCRGPISVILFSIGLSGL
jgi:hypothetical protein